MTTSETPTSAKSSRVERTRTDGRDGRASVLATTGAPQPLSDSDLVRLRAWVRGYRKLVEGGSLSPIVHTAGTAESELAPGEWASITVDDVDRLLRGVAATQVAPAASCNDHHVFPRDPFVRSRRAEVWCERDAGHTGSHEAVRGSTAYSWRKCVTCKTNPPALGTDICAVCHDAV